MVGEDFGLSADSASCSQSRGHAHAAKSGNEYAKKSAAAMAVPAAAAPTPLQYTVFPRIDASLE